MSVCGTPVVTTSITTAIVCLLLVGSVAHASRSCDQGCPATTPFCCVLMDSTMCCPYGTTCDSTVGCVLEDRSQKQGSTDGASDGSRTPLHEAVTSVYLTFWFAGRMVLYALAFISTGFMVSCLHTTLMIKLQNWHRRRQEMAEQRESSDEAVSDAEDVEEAVDEANRPPQQARRIGGRKDDESELQPLTGSSCNGHVVPLSTSVAYDDDSSDPTVAAVNVAGDGEGRCMLCNAPINCVLLKCGHAVICYGCARSLRCCPKCDEKIHRRQKLFMV